MQNERRLIQIRLAPEHALAVKLQATEAQQSIQSYLESLILARLPSRLVDQAEAALNARAD